MSTNLLKKTRALGLRVTERGKGTMKWDWSPGNHFTVSQKLLIILQRQSNDTSGSQLFKILLWAIFFQERRKFWCVPSKGKVSGVWWTQTELLMSSSCMISETLNLRSPLWLPKPSWLLTHEVVSKLNGGQFYRHYRIPEHGI